MQLTFNGTVIAKGRDFAGTDAVMGFDAEGEQMIDVPAILRAAFRPVFPRGNCTITLAGQIIPATAPNLAERLAIMEMVFVNIPKSGALLKQVGSVVSTYPTAGLKTFRALKDLKGISYGYELTFVVTPPGVSAVLQGQAGQTLLSQSGTPLQSQNL